MCTSNWPLHIEKMCVLCAITKPVNVLLWERRAGERPNTLKRLTPLLARRPGTHETIIYLIYYTLMCTESTPASVNRKQHFYHRRVSPSSLHRNSHYFGAQGSRNGHQHNRASDEAGKQYSARHTRHDFVYTHTTQHTKHMRHDMLLMMMMTTTR